MSNETKWFERENLPRAVIDRDNDIWAYDIGASRTGTERTYMSDRGWYFASDLEDCFGPCTPLAPETGQAEPTPETRPALPDDALTVPAGELQVALEYQCSKMLDGMNRADGAGDIEALCALADSIKSVASAAQTISLLSSERWALTPVKELKNDQTN